MSTFPYPKTEEGLARKVCAMPSGHPGPLVQVVATPSLVDALQDALEAMFIDQEARTELLALKLQLDIAMLQQLRQAVKP